MMTTQSIKTGTEIKAQIVDKRNRHICYKNAPSVADVEKWLVAWGEPGWKIGKVETVDKYELIF